jgi:acetyl esterase/lipase
VTINTTASLKTILSVYLFILFSQLSASASEKNSAPHSIAPTQHSLTKRNAPEFDSMALLHPELKPLMQSPQHLIDLLGFQHITQDNLMTLRAKDAAKGYHPNPTIPVTERWLKGQPGQPQVRVFVINAQPQQKRPVILYFHGGGFILGHAADSVLGLQQLAVEQNCVVVSVDYRLAPETIFPGSLEDNYTALLWLYQQADTLGVDKNRIILMGKSAGGGHAAMLAIAARDRAEVPIKQQILIYPMLDDRTGSSRQVPPWIGKFLWTTKSNNFGWSSLLGVPAGSDLVPYGAVPARVENLHGLAPAYIQVGAIDLFAEEDINYAQRLIQAGVPTELVVLPGMFHSAENVFRDAEVSRQFKRLMADAIRRALVE